VCDHTKPDGTPCKLLDVSWLHALGSHHKPAMHEGLMAGYEDFLKHGVAECRSTLM